MNMATDAEKARIHANDPNPIIELDGPPMAYFEVSAGDDSDAPMVRIVYRTLRFASKSEKMAQIAMDTALEDIKEDLRTHLSMKIVWWRMRPEITHEPDHERECNVYHARCRIATTPILSNEFWARWQVEEGEVSKWVE